MATHQETWGNGTPEDMIRLDTRNVFGAQQIHGISAAARRRLKSLHGDAEPLSNQAWKLITEGAPESLEKAERILRACLPRQTEATDERYFSIYWGLGKIAQMQNNIHEALDYFRQAVERYPSAVRNSHLRLLEQMGVINIRTILDGDTHFAETDAAAIASRLIPILSRAAQWEYETFGAKLLKINRRLE